MCAAPLVGMAQSGTDQEVLDKAAVAHSAHCSKRANELHKVKNADGQSVHAVKMATAQHKEKNADGKSVHAVKLHKEKNADGKSVAAVMMCAKRKYNGHADEETANYQCPNCLKYYVFDSPRDKRGKKRVHQQCKGGKAQVLVPYL